VPVDAAVAGTMMTLLSCLLLGGWLIATDRAGLLAIRGHIGLCVFVGIVSALGTILWFLAAAVTNVSYVAAVTQVQIVFALLLRPPSSPAATVSRCCPTSPVRSARSTSRRPAACSTG
jgi:uncharacterized membrane protein